MGLKDLLLVIGQAKGLSERVNDDAGTIVTQVRIASCDSRQRRRQDSQWPWLPEGASMCCAHVGPIGDDNE